ncbi:MAG: ATP-dependent helicase [Nitrospirota bacterium]|nr:ATP-dependent helicase [Nitrospirota bacterium]MDH5574724.1 ATP-dependent helicase [Nitrospirota bacterium]
MDSTSQHSKVYVLKRPLEESTPPKLSRNYAAELNPQQLAAVEVVEGPALVIAGAGSGKTRTLVYRVARLIDLGISPSSILLLTFTRKAAQEMLSRVGLLIGLRSQQVGGGTFHSMANILLRRYGRPVGLEPGFTILDRGDSEDLLSLLRGQLGLNDTGKRFPRKHTLAEIFGKSANTLESLEDIVLNEYSHFGEYLGELQKIQAAYEAAKRQRQLVDYDDLLVKLLELLVIDQEARETISQIFRYILVDEYQDTNRLQASLVRNLAATHQNVMVVGDDSQSIYAFRGATFRNIMEFPNLFPGTTIYKLEENYRSTQPILQLANKLIEAAPEKYSKTLFTRKEEGPLPIVVQAMGENAQSRFIAQKILELREEGIALDEIAVLFRSSFHAFDLELELTRRNLPFIKRGGFKFIETAHVKDLMAHLRVIHNPLDTVSWNRLLLLIEGVGPKKAKDLIALILQAHGQYEGLKHSTGRSSSGLRHLAATLDHLTEEPLSPAMLLGEMMEYYVPLLKDQYDDYPKRIRDLEHLTVMAERYESLNDFLADLTLEPPNESVVDVEAPDRDDERLILSTIHSAKGLEWHSVFVIWLVDGRFPSAYSFMTPEELEEERRLLYVAVTRAKNHLFLTYPINVYDKMTGSVLSKPSRYLDHIPSSYFDTWSLVEEDQTYSWR